MPKKNSGYATVLLLFISVITRWQPNYPTLSRHYLVICTIVIVYSILVFSSIQNVTFLRSNNFIAE